MPASFDLTKQPASNIQQRLLAVTQAQPKNFLAWLLLGWTAASAEQAAQYFKQALLIRPGHPLAQDGLDMVQAGNWQAVELHQLNWHRLVQAGESAEPSFEILSPVLTRQPGTPEIALREASQGISTAQPVQEERAGETVIAAAGPASPPATDPNRKARGSAWNAALWTAGFYLAAIILAEWLTTLRSPALGVTLHALILLGLLIHSALSQQRTRQRMLATLAMAPLIRVVSLSLPLADYTAYLWYMIVGAPLLLSALMVTRYSGYRLSEIGLRFTKLPWQLLVGLSGIGLGYLEYSILHPQPLVQSFSLEQIWLPALILILFTGLLEEFIFRGLMQNAFTAGLGKRLGLVYVSVVFAVLHFGYLSVVDVVFVFGVALFFGWVTLRTGSIWGVTLAHGLTNVSLFLIYPFILN
jgi:hypothetical protein